MPNIVLYTRRGCHLCDEALAVLVRHGLRPRLVDIDADPQLVARYNECVPVVEIDGQEQLRGLASELHPQWAAELKVTTGIETGYCRCGGLHLARTPGEAAALTAWAALVREEGIQVERLESADVWKVEQGLQGGANPPR